MVHQKKIKPLFKWKPSKGKMYMKSVPVGESFIASRGYGTVVAQSIGSTTVIWHEFKNITSDGNTEMRSNIRQLISPNTEVKKRKYDKHENRGENLATARKSKTNNNKSTSQHERRENISHKGAEGANNLPPKKGGKA